MSFVHLRTHTEFSIVDGTLRVADAAALAARHGQPAVAITDLNNLFGAVKLYNQARKQGVQPILGADIWLSSPEGWRLDTPLSRLLLLVQNTAGYLNLCRLLSMAWLQAPVAGKACVPWDALAAHSEGLIALSGAEMGAVGLALLAQDAPRAQRIAQDLSQALGGRRHLLHSRCQVLQAVV